MNKNKSINELLSSIVSLINEAKNEYEFVINKDLPERIHPEKERIQKEYTTNVEKKSNNVFQSEINSFGERHEKRFNNWQNINFGKTIRKSNTKSFSRNFSPPNNQEIEAEFSLLLDSWLKRNLNNLIQNEISTHIKNRQN